MRRSLLSGRTALINLFIAAFAIFLVFNAFQGGVDPTAYVPRDTSNELRLSHPITASEYVEIDGSPYLLLMAKHDNERIETADLRIISVDPDKDLEQASWIHTSMSVQRPPEALTYGNGHVYVGLAREGTERPALWVVDLSNPGRPFEANLLHADFPLRSLAASEDGYMIAAGFDDELLIYDISQGNEPYVVARFTAPVEMPPELYLDGTTLFLQHGAGVILYDMTDPESPELIGDYDYPAWQEPEYRPSPDDFLLGDEGFELNLPRQSYLDLAIGEDQIALAAGIDGFTLGDPRRSSDLTTHTLLQLEGRVASVSIDGDSMFLLSGRLQSSPRVRFVVSEVDISDPENPDFLSDANSTTITGLPRYQRIIAQDGNVWILFNQNVIRYRTLSE